MPESRDVDRWRELADLLGLPPEENKSAGPAPAAHEERRDEAHREDAHLVETRQNEPRRREWEPAPTVTDVEEAEPVAEDSFEPVSFEEEIQGEVSHADVVPPLDSSDELSERELAEPVSGGPETQRERAEPDGDSSRERPRRGRRRGRRGNRGDARESDERPRNERARVEQTRTNIEDTPAKGVGAESSREPADEEERHFEGARERPTEDADEEEDFEREGTAAPKAFEEDDDEEVDKLTDWNVPSWTELISSLYRPER